jgi:hypothetical protein
MSYNRLNRLRKVQRLLIKAFNTLLKYYIDEEDIQDSLQISIDKLNDLITKIERLLNKNKKV